MERLTLCIGMHFILVFLPLCVHWVSLCSRRHRLEEIVEVIDAVLFEDAVDELGGGVKRVVQSFSKV